VVAVGAVLAGFEDEQPELMSNPIAKSISTEREINLVTDIE
jgi:hypothetical protein